MCTLAGRTVGHRGEQGQDMGTEKNLQRPAGDAINPQVELKGRYEYFTQATRLRLSQYLLSCSQARFRRSCPAGDVGFSRIEQKWSGYIFLNRVCKHLIVCRVMTARAATWMTKCRSWDVDTLVFPSSSSEFLLGSWSVSSSSSEDSSSSKDWKIWDNSSRVRNSRMPIPRSAIPGFRIHHLSGDGFSLAASSPRSMSSPRSYSSSAQSSSSSSAKAMSIDQVLGTARVNGLSGCLVR